MHGAATPATAARSCQRFRHRRWALVDAERVRIRLAALIELRGRAHLIAAAALRRGRIRDEVSDRVRRDWQAGANVAPLAAARRAGARDLRIDADHATARIEQRATRVARIYGGIGLDY